MRRPADHCIPDDVIAVLTALASKPTGRSIDAQAAEKALQILNTLPAGMIGHASGALPWIFGLNHHDSSNWEWRWWRGRRRQQDLLRRVPSYAWLFLFHRDGRMRQAALESIYGAAPSPFFFAALALRLNDWADPVRQAAFACAHRVFPRTPPEVIAAAAPWLLRQNQRWGRWMRFERTLLNGALQRPDVVEVLGKSLCDARNGPAGATLRAALREPGFDARLEALANDAFLPDVRRVAVQALIERRIRWPTHREKRWIDKSMGRYRRDWVYAERQIEAGASRETIVAQAARDRSILVRRVAVVALLTIGRELDNFDEIAALLARDRNAALRERARFAIDMPAATAPAI